MLFVYWFQLTTWTPETPHARPLELADIAKFACWIISETFVIGVTCMSVYSPQTGSFKLMSNMLMISEHLASRHEAPVIMQNDP